MREKKLMRWLSFLSVCVLTAVMVIGCGEKQNNDTKDDSGKESGENAEKASEEDIPKIYTMLEQTPLAGLDTPYMEDRSEIDKAWPKEPANKDEIVIGWAELTMSNPWFVTVAESADKTAEEYGFTLKRQVADFDVATQSAQIDSFITQGVDVIVVNPADMMAVVSDVERAVQSGIPVICSAAVPDASAPVLTSIASSPWGCGFEVGKYVADQYKENEPVSAAVVIGVMGSPTSEGRVNGMITGFVYQRLLNMGQDVEKEDAYLRGYKLFEEVRDTGKCKDEEINFSIDGWGIGDWTEEGGLSATDDILTAAPDLDLIFAENDFMGMGALKAIDNIGKKDEIKVACCADGYKEALELVQKGELIADGTNSGVQQGAEVVRFINMIFNEDFDPNNMPVGSYFTPYAITKDNIDKFYNADDPFFNYEEHEFLSIPELVKKLEAQD